MRGDGGLKPRDLAAIERTRASLAANPPVTDSRQALVRVSPDRTTALVIVNLNPHGKETLLKSSVSGPASRGPRSWAVACALRPPHATGPRRAELFTSAARIELKPVVCDRDLCAGKPERS